jgi:hypothetical protein
MEVTLLGWDETPEETHAKVDEILARNTQEPKICISCQELITDRQTLVTTSHGPYHGWPMTCLEGRSDDDIPWDQK